MIVDGYVHIGKSIRRQINVDGEMLVRIADTLHIDIMCCTDLTALFYDMHEGNRLLYKRCSGFQTASSDMQAFTPRGSARKVSTKSDAVAMTTACMD